jgi:hypothetical protein
MSDILASARSMTTYSDNQYVAVGFPKGGLTPATITAMVGFSQGEGLQMSPMVGAALDKIKSATSATIAGLPAGAASALSNVGITTETINASTDPAQTVQGIKDALATDGIMLDTATENSLTSTIGLTSKIESLSSKLMAGGPAAFMSKFNAARGHIADAIEIKKVTAFTANQVLEGFGSGMKKMSSLSSNGLDGVMGNMAAAGAAMAAAGPLFDMGDIKNMGSPLGIVKKLLGSKMSKSTGVTGELTKAGVDINDLENPSFADKIGKVMSSITDPKALKDVADQMGIKPPGGLPSVGKQSFAGIAAANPFTKLPGYSGADSSLNTSAAATLLGGATAAPAPIEPVPEPILPSPVEASSTPDKWASVNDLTTDVPPPAQSKADKLIIEIDALFQVVIDGSDVYARDGLTIIEQYESIDVRAADATEQLTAMVNKLRDEYSDKLGKLSKKMFDAANAAIRLTEQLPIKTNAERIIRNSYVDQRSGPIENLLRITDQTNRNAAAALKEMRAKIAAAKGGLTVTTT